MRKVAYFDGFRTETGQIGGAPKTNPNAMISHTLTSGITSFTPAYAINCAVPDVESST